MKKLLLIFSAIFCLLINVIAQNRTITGKVSDDKGQAVPGASVMVKGTKIGTTTNIEGDYALSIPLSAKRLVVSSVDMTTEEVVINGSNINITLAGKVDNLEDVIVVGYSSKKAKYLSSSISTVSGEKLRDVTSNSVLSLLQGKAPGVVVSSGSGDPTSTQSIIIRGQGTISAAAGPLVVVDGIIGGTYNPTDVETITILKDAAATGLYGSRAGNGVLIITTKTGRSGKSKIEFRSTVGFNEATNGNFKLMNTQQLYDYHKLYSPANPAVLNTDTDWWDLAFRQSMTQSYTLSASGGNDKTQYYVSGNYYKEEGTLENNDRTGYNFRTNLTHKLSNKLKLSVLLNGISTKDNNNVGGAESTLYQAYTNLPYDSAYNVDGTPRDPRTVATWYGRGGTNFVYNLQYNQAADRDLNVSGDLNLDYSITKHLSFATYNRVSFINGKTMNFIDRRTQAAAGDGGRLTNSSSYTNVLTTSNRLRYDNSFGVHNISVLAVGEATQSYFDVLSTAVKNLPPGRPFASTATEYTSVTGGNNQYSFHKYLAQTDYNYANKYFAVASLVRDRSSRFGNNNSAGNFYQLGASWIISNEAFLSSIKPISFLKLRASYGTTGNAEIGDYAALGLYLLTSGAAYANTPGAAPSQKPNPDLTWEKQKAANLGLDISLFKRIDLSIDAYQKTAHDLLYQKPLPATTGYTTVWENIGSVQNKGIELNLTTKNFTGKLFTWETNLNMAFNRNKVLELNEGALFRNVGAKQPIALGHDIDEWYMPVWAGVDPATGDPLWERVTVDADGRKYITYSNSYNSVANITSRQLLGKSAAPKFTGGITNSFAYKGFSLTTFLNFVYGNYVYNDTRFYFDNDGVYTTFNNVVLAEGWSRWEKPGDIATHPKPLLNGNKASNSVSSRYLEDGSYIRLRNITLGYNLPTSIISRLKLSTARLFISGDNLWTGTSFTGPDPEALLTTGEFTFRYPTSKKILFGLNISF